jgi:hypothetical protein
MEASSATKSEKESALAAAHALNKELYDLVDQVDRVGRDLRPDQPPSQDTSVMSKKYYETIGKCEELVKKGARPDAFFDGNTALHTTIQSRLVPVMLKGNTDNEIYNKVNTEVVDKNGHTPLSHSVARVDLPVAKEFVKGGSDVNIVNSAGLNILQIACLSSDPELVEWILGLKNFKYGVNDTAVENERTPIKVCAQSCNDNAEVLEVLIKHGAELYDGIMADVYAAHYKKRTFHKLIELGLDPEKNFIDGKSIMDIAKEDTKYKKHWKALNISDEKVVETPDWVEKFGAGSYIIQEDNSD